MFSSIFQSHTMTERMFENIVGVMHFYRTRSFCNLFGMDIPCYDNTHVVVKSGRPQYCRVPMCL